MHHSLVYRSVVVVGEARIVDDPEEKLRALHACSTTSTSGRAADCRTPNSRELAATAVLALDLVEVSAKVRTGGAVDEPEDCALPHWAGSAAAAPDGRNTGPGRRSRPHHPGAAVLTPYTR